MYELHALLAPVATLERLAPHLPAAQTVVVPLALGIGLIPVIFELPPERLALVARHAPVGLVEVETSSGLGNDAGTFWGAGAAPVDFDGRSINAVLGALGIGPDAPTDAFDRVGCGRHRRTVRWFAEALIPAGSADAVSFLAYDNPNDEAREEVRERALKVLGALGPAAAAAIPAVFDSARRDPDLGVRLGAILALGKLGPGAVPALAALLAAPGGEGRWAVCRALGEIGPAAATHPILAALAALAAGDDYSTRTEAAKALSLLV